MHIYKTELKKFLKDVVLKYYKKQSAVEYQI